MKKLLFAIALICVTAAFDQKASMVVRPMIEPAKSVTLQLDSLAGKLEYLNEINGAR